MVVPLMVIYNLRITNFPDTEDWEKKISQTSSDHQDSG